MIPTTPDTLEEKIEKIGATQRSANEQATTLRPAASSPPALAGEHARRDGGCGDHVESVDVKERDRSGGLGRETKTMLRAQAVGTTWPSRIPSTRAATTTTTVMSARFSCGIRMASPSP
jgi:hypothetical protein